MPTYSVRCRNAYCRARKVIKKHPAEYKIVPKCKVCGQTKGWRIEGREYSKRNLCRCAGPVSSSGYNFPHKTDHPLCDQHPEGYYNQAKRAGVEDEDIPVEYLPERFKSGTDTDCPF